MVGLTIAKALSCCAFWRWKSQQLFNESDQFQNIQCVATGSIDTKCVEEMDTVEIMLLILHPPVPRTTFGMNSNTAYTERNMQAQALDICTKLQWLHA